jgi:serine/threonine-protein kinase
VDARIQTQGPFTVVETAALLDQVAGALAEAHAAGIIHRDIKPENLFLVAGPDGQPFVKVLDFGIAKLAERPQNPRLTQEGALLGTPSFAAPEQLLGAAVDGAADIYALGATAFEMLCGRPPFEGDLANLMLAKTTREAPSVDMLRPDVPAAICRTLARMLARDPAERPASMVEVRDEIARWAAQVKGEGTRPRVGLSKVAVTLALALTVGSLGFFAVRSRSGDQRRPAQGPAVAAEAALQPSPPPPSLPVAPTKAAAPPAQPAPVAPAPRVKAHLRPSATRKAKASKPAAPVPAESKRGDIIIADPFEK